VRILLGDRLGRVQAELDEGAISDVVWRLNEAGTATLNIVRTSAAFRQELLDPGARLYVEFDNGLPPWGGVLDLPRTWTPGALKVQVYTIERLLEFQLTSKSRLFIDALVGTIFFYILQEVEKRAKLGLTLGQVWSGGGTYSEGYPSSDAMSVINRSIRELENCDYRFVPYLNKGRIMFRAELHERLGEDKHKHIALIEGANVAAPTLTEQGDIVNRIFVKSAGATEAEQWIIPAIEETSRQQYGLREKIIAPSRLSLVSTGRRYADRAIREYAFPHVFASMDVVDVKPARFVDYDIGDIVWVSLSSFGFDGYGAPMRIVARGFDPGTGKCELVCSEQFEYLPIIQTEVEKPPEDE